MPEPDTRAKIEELREKLRKHLAEEPQADAHGWGDDLPLLPEDDETSVILPRTNDTPAPEKK